MAMCAGCTKGVAMTSSNDISLAPAPIEASPEEQPRAPRVPPFIVGIGASAGGLDAFTAFFTAMPPDSGMAFVLVQHLDPQQPSLLPELLAPHTAMAMHPVVDRIPIAPNQLYLISPNTMLMIDQGMLCLAMPLEAHGRRMPKGIRLPALTCGRRGRGISPSRSARPFGKRKTRNDRRALGRTRHGAMTRVRV